MVLKEINHEEAGAEPASLRSNSITPPVLEKRLAAPIDRLAAAVADFVLISPVVTLAMSPFKRQAIEAQLAGHDEAWAMAFVSGALTAALVVVLFQTLCLIKWRATPGKMLFGLRIETLWSETDGGVKTLNPMSAFLRSVVFCLEILMLGLPWLAVLSNERRRSFHDRIADTVVISKRARKVGPPNLSEMAFSSGLLAAVLTSVALVSTFKLVQMGYGPHSVVADLESSGDLCQIVGDSEKSWIPAIGEKTPSRIGVALSLYQADVIDEECLKLEADYAMWNGGSKDLAYLARGLAEKTDDELAQSYLDKACENGSTGEACKALTLLREPEVPEDEVEAKTALVQHENEIHEIVSDLTSASPAFLKIVAIRELSEMRNFSGALALIDGFSPQQNLSYFLSSVRTKALWNLGRQAEARLALRTSVGGFDPDQRLALSRWFCQKETSQNGCGLSEKAACDLVSSAVQHDEELLQSNEIAVTYLRAESCSDRLDESRLAELKPKLKDASAVSYVEALGLIAKGKRLEARELLAKLGEDADKSGPFFMESNATLADLAETKEELSVIETAWADTDPSEEGWRFLGARLMERYNKLKAWDQTLRVGLKLGENEDIDLNAARSLVVAAYRSGHLNLAGNYLEMFSQRSGGQRLDSAAVVKDRMPASSDGFEEIVREISGIKK